jgi:hypothetical protein
VMRRKKQGVAVTRRVQAAGGHFRNYLRFCGHASGWLKRVAGAVLLMCLMFAGES